MGRRCLERFVALNLLTLMVGCSTSAYGEVPPPRVVTHCGEIEGVWDSSRTGLAAFLGIPFAQPPVGHLRWKPTVAASCWAANMTLMATVEPPACPQFRHSASVNEAESCLFLNVFTANSSATAARSDKQATSKKPVFVWLYGGGNTDGSVTSYGQIQNIVSAMDDEVVLVALNYRLGTFGFLALRELSQRDPRGTSGNFGILDAQMGLQWVQENIEHFGGDANRVTVFGQSSGGTDVLALLASPASRGLFAAAMSLSGSPNISMTLSELEMQGEELVKAVGCDKNVLNSINASNAIKNADPVLECMYDLDYRTLQAATPSQWSYSGSFDKDTQHGPASSPYPGLVGVDGITVPYSIEEAYARAVVDVPVIFSTMQSENGVSEAKMAWTKSAEFAQYCETQFLSPPWEHGVANRTFSLYEKLSTENASFAYASLTSDVMVSCGNAELAVTAAGAFSSPVYLAVSTHWPSQCVGSSCFPYHTWDTTSAFETWVADGLPQPTAADRAFGSSVRSLWRGLAFNGKLPWPEVSATSNFPASYATLRVDTNVSFVVDMKTHNCQQLKQLGLGKKFWWVN